jgi:hypothetical protein
MKQIFLFSLLAALGLFVSASQKQQGEAERNAEIERQVQQRLDAEHQAEEQQKLVQRQAELDAREQAFAAKENQSRRQRALRTRRHARPSLFFSS